jgi:hypothetical protein
MNELFFAALSGLFALGVFAGILVEHSFGLCRRHCEHRRRKKIHQIEMHQSETQRLSDRLYQSYCEKNQRH